MLRLLISAAFVGANFAASFAVVVLIARLAGEAERATFFAFQAVFFVMVVLSSQTAILQGYRGASNARAQALTEAALFAGGLAALWAMTGASPGDLVAYAVSGIVSARAASAMAALQFEMTDWRLGAVPVVSAICRVLAAWMLMGPVGLGPAPAFLGAAAVHLAIALAARAWHAPRARPGPEPVPGPDGYWQMLLFIAGTAFAFQWDRMVLSGLGADALVVTAGVTATWVLAPLSLAFATLYRASARDIFTRGHAPAAAGRIFARHLGLFVVAGSAWLIFVWLFWVPLNALMFPFFQGEAALALLLGAAIMADRAGNLAAFIGGRRFGLLAALKGGLIAAAVLSVLLPVLLPVRMAGTVPDLETIFTAYLVQSLAWALLSAALLFGGRRAS